MPRLMFEKKGDSVWISHLDLMRLFQRAFKRAGLPLTHTQGYNPRPSVSIALPMSVGIESSCEFLDFDLDNADVPCEEIAQRLNDALVEGIRVLSVYNDGSKIKDLAHMDCEITLEYDSGTPQDVCTAIRELLSKEDVTVEKKNKNGVSQQNIIPMIQSFEVRTISQNEVLIAAKICCQNPTLNPMQIVAAIGKYLPDYVPDFVKYSRIEVYNCQGTIFR